VDSSNYFVLLQPDGRPLLGASRLKRLLNNEAARQELSVKLWGDDTASIHWARSGAAPEVERVVFEAQYALGACLFGALRKLRCGGSICWL
jgi:hypothetical protein